MKKPALRTGNLMALVVCIALLGYAYYAQYGMGLEPCPLCIFQRVVFVALGVLFLIAVLHNPGVIGARVYAGLIGLTGGIGIGLSGRHLYIQSLPEGSVPACGATLDYLMDVFPLMHVIRKVLTGSGECGKVDWTFLGLSMPGWTLIAFLGLAAWGIWINWRRNARLAGSPR